MKHILLLFLFACSSFRYSNPHRDALPVLENIAGWKNGHAPSAPSEFEVIKFSEKLKRPIWAYETPGGDVLIAEEDQITLLRDTDGDGKPEVRSVFLKNLSRPLGMFISGSYFYVATTDAVRRFSYQEGAVKIVGAGEKILSLPDGGKRNHWMRNIISSLGQNKIYVSVGSYSDAGEYGMEMEKNRAQVLMMDADGKNPKVFASGLRNPIGMDWHPHTGLLWVVVSEREHPKTDDYLTVIKQDHFYGWPYYYWGKKRHPAWKEKIPKKLPRVAVPHVKLGSSAGSFGLTFYRGKAFGPKYRSGAFVSHTRAHTVSFVPFSKGYPSGPTEDFLTGFISTEDATKVYGRPSGVIELNRGDLLVCDDMGGAIWLIRSKDGLSQF